MKMSISARLLLAGWSMALAACSSSPMSRIDANRGKYDSYPIEVRQAILDGEAIKGMTPEQVEMALGKPTEIITRSAKGGDDEVWVYRKSEGLGGTLRNTGISIGAGTGGVGGGVSTSTGGRRETPEESEVVFRNGVVSRSDAKR